MKQSRLKSLKIAIYIILIIIAELLMKNGLKAQALREELITTWTVDYNGVTCETGDLENCKIPNARKGDHIEISGILPESHYTQTTLEFIMHCSTVKVYVDDVLIATYGEELAQNNRLLGSGLFRAALPDDFEGKRLKLVLDVQENGVFSKLPSIYIAETIYTSRNILVLNFQSALMIGLLLMVAVAETGVLIVFHKHRKQAGMLWMNVGFTLSLATWLLCYSGIIHIFTENYGFVSRLGYISLYLIPVYVLFFLYMSLKGKRYANVAGGIAVVYLIFDVAAVVMNYLNIVHFPESLRYYHILLVLSCMFVVFIVLRFRQEMRMYYGGVYFWGIYLLVFTVLIELVRYVLYKYALLDMDLSESFLAFGGFIIAVIIFAGLILSLKNVLIIQSENEMLKHAAYTDALTHLKNRAYCEEQFQYYLDTKKPVAIVNLDLNMFKAVNDTYGHSAGDELLIRFAQILKDVFADCGTVGRMGGDEFIVIMEYKADTEVDKYIQRLLKCVEADNRVSVREYKLSVSYGYANNFERPDIDIKGVYEEADQRMYRYKQSVRMEVS